MDARRIARQSEAACAKVINVSETEFRQFETGQAMPSLPQLEVLAYYLNVPLEHFWENQVKSEQVQFSLKSNSLIPLRQKVIGITIRQLRQDRNLSLEEFAEQIEIQSDTLKRYELGEEAIPLPLLEYILANLDENINIVTDHHGQIGRWYKQQKTVGSLSTYPEDIQEFISKSVNEPYLELARRLSGFDANKLRAIAEGLLEITY